MTDKPFDLVALLHWQRDFIFKTFGPGLRTKGLCEHIKKELLEIQANPVDSREWIDVIILGFDGLLRTGVTPEQAIELLVAKHDKNGARVWPDWRTVDPDKAIEHDRSHDAADGTGQNSQSIGPKATRVIMNLTKDNVDLRAKLDAVRAWVPQQKVHMGGNVFVLPEWAREVLSIIDGKEG